jgi:transposase
MNRSIRIEIAETAEALKLLHKQQPDKHLAQRLLFLYLLKTGTLTRLSQGPKLLNLHRHTLRRWLNTYLEGGLDALLQRESPPGRTSSISPELEAKFEERVNGVGFPGGYREAFEFAQEHGSDMGYFGIRKYLRTRFGTKLKVARPQHHKQDKEALEAFKKKTLKPKSAKRSTANLVMGKSTSISKTKADLGG